ncbi:MAG TPA: hypothetical protein RMH99_32405 [Sandaracinaceae bacterium LLY-WYZ-13_1]|nr:hypothetical protein [Sandaracinaceae bacterium LLY-WYZ-13_1]
MRAIAIVGLLVAGAGCAPPGAADDAKSDVPKTGPRIAGARDFAAFRSWRRYHLPEDTLTEVGHHSSPHRYVYVDRALPPEPAPIPLGTLIVKTTEDGPPETWDVHAMVKRGDGYNWSGCDDWEFFNLSLDADGAVSIRWRGRGDDASAYEDAEGHARSCNSCHIHAREVDHVFSRRLVPALGRGAHPPGGA